MRSKHQPYELGLYLKKISEYKALSLEEELELARQYKNGNQEAGQTIINANLRMAFNISKTFFYRMHNPLDIVQEGNMGLMKALTMYDPDRGLKFFSYAVWWVKAYVRNFIYKNTKGTLEFGSKLFPLDSALTGDTDDSFIDHIPDESANQEEEFSAKQERLLLSQVLSSDNTLLTSREKYILMRRFFEEPRPSLAQIAQKLNITKERIRQLESKSLGILKDHMEERYSLVMEDFTDTYRNSISGHDVFASIRAAC